MFTGDVNSPYYKTFLGSKVPLYLDLPCVTRGKMWLQHDGAFPHFGREVKEFYVYGSVHHNILYEITNRCSYMQSILFHC